MSSCHEFSFKNTNMMMSVTFLKKRNIANRFIQRFCEIKVLWFILNLLKKIRWSKVTRSQICLHTQHAPMKAQHAAIGVYWHREKWHQRLLHNPTCTCFIIDHLSILRSLQLSISFTKGITFENLSIGIKQINSYWHDVLFIKSYIINDFGQN